MPQQTLKDLPPDGIVIWATLYVPGPWSHGVTQRSLPLDLGDADVRHSWEGQPNGNVPEYVLWQEVNGYFLDVRVYFGTQDPSHGLTMEAQAELAQLVVP